MVRMRFLVMFTMFTHKLNFMRRDDEKNVDDIQGHSHENVKSFLAQKSTVGGDGNRAVNTDDHHHRCRK